MPGGFSGAQAASGAFRCGRPPSSRWPRDSDNIRVTRAWGPNACSVLRRAEMRCTGSQTPRGIRARFVIRGGVLDFLSHTVPLAGRTGRPGAGPAQGSVGPAAAAEPWHINGDIPSKTTARQQLRVRRLGGESAATLAAGPA